MLCGDYIQVLAGLGAFLPLSGERNMSKSEYNRLLFTTIDAIIGLTGSPSIAQEAQDKAETITVTARQISESVQDVPGTERRWGIELTARI